MKMNTVAVLRFFLVAALICGSLFTLTAQEAASVPATNLPAATEAQGQADLADVVMQLQRVNEQLAKAFPEKRVQQNVREYPKSGGAFYTPYRNFLTMGTLNTWLAGQGNFAPLNANWFPFVNGWGGAWRWSMSKNFQIGLGGWGGGVSSLGQRNATTHGSIDEDSDGLDDYYSYAGYSLSFCDFEFYYRLPIGSKMAFISGAIVGLGSESMVISRNDRTFVNNSGFGGLINDSNWTRFLFDLGLRASFQWQPFEGAKWFRFAINTGFNYPVAPGPWRPGAGVHVSDVAPPESWIPMNYWASFTVDFNF